MTAPQADAELEMSLSTLRAGDPAKVVALFQGAPGQREPLLRALLAEPGDAPVAAAFTALWQDIGAQSAGLLRWYLTSEATAMPRRRACHAAVLARVLATDPFPPGEGWAALGFAAARVALERGGQPDLRSAASALLRRIDPSGAMPLAPEMVFAAIHAVDLTLLRPMIDRWPKAAAMTPDLKRALDWAMGLVIEFAGIDPWAEAALERRYLFDPQDPLAAQRSVQLGLHRGQGFAGLAAPLLHMRHDPQDSHLKSVLQFAYWQAQNIGDDALSARFQSAIQALDPGWTDAPAAPPQAQPAIPDVQLGDDLAGLVQAALGLAAVDLRLDGAWPPERLHAAFAGLAEAIETAPLAPGWGLAQVLQAAQNLLQIDRREYSWITHFEQSPHAMGQPRYGLVDLRLIPLVHQGLMALIAALCRNGLAHFLAHDPPGGLGPVARLVQLHGRAALEIDQPQQAGRMLDLVAARGILADVVAIERDNLALALGRAPDTTPPPRLGSRFHPFLPREGWSGAEGISWQVLATDVPVPGRFDVVWPDARLERAEHATPPGRIATASVPGLSLVAEDFLIGPGGSVLRPDPYHTSAEFPWPNAVMVAAGRRALRLRPTAQRHHPGPVLVLEAFEALRWRNYYHWMVPILSRVAMALDRSLLADRRLVVPAGLSGWMLETLALLGLTDERLFTLPPGEEATFSDALLLSSVEHVSSACLTALRRCLLGQAAPADPAGPALFLSRRGQKARRMTNEDRIEAMAAEMGFQVIAPQDLGIAGQVALFAQARGVAAVEGAALTNTLFCPPGVRVLALCCENDMMPIFNDLSIVLGHHHRKLAGQGLPVTGRGNRFQPPFAVDSALAHGALSWVLAGPEGAKG